MWRVDKFFYYFPAILFIERTGPIHNYYETNSSNNMESHLSTSLSCDINVVLPVALKFIGLPINIHHGCVPDGSPSEYKHGSQL